MLYFLYFVDVNEINSEINKDDVFYYLFGVCFFILFLLKERKIIICERNFNWVIFFNLLDIVKFEKVLGKDKILL